MILILAGPLACCPQEPGQVGNEAAILVYSSAEDKARRFREKRLRFSIVLTSLCGGNYHEPVTLPVVPSDSLYYCGHARPRGIDDADEVGSLWLYWCKVDYSWCSLYGLARN